MTMLTVALDALARGFAIFPLAPGGKTPATGHGFKDATRDAARVRQWWTANPAANIGVATGPASGIWVLDVDSKPGLDGYAALRALEAKHSRLDFGLLVKTPSCGQHIYFAWDPAREVRSSASRLGPGLDTRGIGGYVVGPGSRRPDGEYEIYIDDPLPVAPAWLIDLLDAPRPVVVRGPVTVTPAQLPLDIASESRKAAANLERLSPARVEHYDDWYKVGMALSELGAEGLALWDQWSRRSPKYRPGECQRKWGSWQPGHGLTLASLTYWADSDSPRIRTNHAITIGYTTTSAA